MPPAGLLCRIACVRIGIVLRLMDFGVATAKYWRLFVMLGFNLALRRPPFHFLGQSRLLWRRSFSASSGHLSAPLAYASRTRSAIALQNSGWKMRIA